MARSWWVALCAVVLLGIAPRSNAQEDADSDPQTPMPLLLTDPAGEEAPGVQDSAPGPAGDQKPKPPPPSPYKGVFYDNDFSYLGKPGARREHYYEWLKWLKPCDDLRFDFGGEFRHQFKDEVNRRALFIGAPTNPQAEAFHLYRTRAYGDVHYKDWIRGYIEFIDAAIAQNSLPPLLIDEDRTDLLNYFVDVKVPFLPEKMPTYARVGRQELIYGEQRLISPLDWANTRRTFSDGLKVFSRGEKWDVDVFYGRPSIVDGDDFNQADQSQWFGGLYTTYNGYEHFKISPYFLVLREEDTIPGPAVGRMHRIGSGESDTRVFTSGFQWQGGIDNWLFDVEADLQFGAYGDQDVIAGAVAAGLGRKMPDLTWSPTVWVWYDYASGDNDPFDNTINTFNQLFPLAHKYYGFIDLVARQNAHDANFQVFLNPHKKLTILLWQHFFFLASDRDGLYNAAGVVSFQDPTGRSGAVIGQETDLLATWKFGPNADVGIGYSYFWSGDFIKDNGGNSFASFLYTQMHVRF